MGTVEDALARDAQIPFSKEKLGAVLLYLAERSKDDPLAGATKINKLFFFIDFTAYQQLGHPITGAKYIKHLYGPVPSEIDTCKRALIRANELEETRPKFMFENTRLKAHVQPRMDLFTPEERQHIDSVIEDLRPYTGTDLSKITHVLPGYEQSEMFERIPYFTAFLPDPEEAAEMPPPAADQAERARVVAERILGRSVKALGTTPRSRE